MTPGRAHFAELPSNNTPGTVSRWGRSVMGRAAVISVPAQVWMMWQLPARSGASRTAGWSRACGIRRSPNASTSSFGALHCRGDKHSHPFGASARGCTSV